MARRKLVFGYSANDNQGEVLRDGAISIEQALSELYFFLSGGTSETVLPLAIPEIRGGSGSGTTEGSRQYIRRHGLRSFVPGALQYMPAAVCTVAYGRLPKSVALTTLTGELSFIRLGEGIYKVTVPAANLVVDANRVYIAPDKYGNQKFCAEVTQVGMDITINVHPVVWDDTLKEYKADTLTLVDVPADSYMTFIISNSLVNAD